MGQYYLPVNVTKRQFIHPCAFNDYQKLLEFAPGSNGTMLALAILLADGNGRGGGDLQVRHEGKEPFDESTFRPDQKVEWENKSRFVPDGEKPTYYAGIVSKIVGSWAGDRIVVTGDYADDNHLSRELVREWCKAKGFPATVAERGLKLTETYDTIDGRTGTKEWDFSRKDQPNLYDIAETLFEDISDKVLLALCDDKNLKDEIVETAAHYNWRKNPRWLSKAVSGYHRRKNKHKKLLTDLSTARDGREFKTQSDFIAYMVQKFQENKKEITWEHLRYMLSEIHQNPYSILIEMFNAPKTAKIELPNVDWKMLRKQKEALVSFGIDQMPGSDIPPEIQEAVSGITHLLDSIQDQAAKQLGDEKVFGEPETVTEG